MVVRVGEGGQGRRRDNEEMRGSCREKAENGNWSVGEGER